MPAFTLYLIRHAEAAERGDAWPDDTVRPLTADGRRRFEHAVEGLARLEVSIDLVLASPLTRTRQTAEILSRVLPEHPKVVDVKALAPGGTHAAIVAALTEHATHSSLAVVGHEPGLGTLAARLMGTRAPLAFKKGAVCRIDLGSLPPSGPGTLKWFVTPRMLRALA
jgi:phosphohistidine phosphatase